MHRPPSISRPPVRLGSEPVYIPKFVYIDKHKVDNYKWLRTETYGKTLAHFLQHVNGKEYMMCIRSDDNISHEDVTMMPMGYKNKNLAVLEALYETFRNAYKNDNLTTVRSIHRSWVMVVQPPKIDFRLVGTPSMANHYLVHLVYNLSVELSRPVDEIKSETGLSDLRIKEILEHGHDAANWCYKGERIDKLDWDTYFAERGDDPDLHLYFENIKTLEKTYYISLRVTAPKLGVSHEHLRLAMIQNKSTIGAWRIVRKK